MRIKIIFALLLLAVFFTILCSCFAQTNVPLDSLPTTEVVLHDAESETNEKICFLTVTCESVLDRLDDLNSDKLDIIPENGIILEKKEIIFNEGESVFNVLQRELKKQKIHFEYNSLPGGGTVYIEGINNLYEFDCGPESGWIYFVNSESMGQSCDSAILKNGDEIVWFFTCELTTELN